MEDEDQPQAVVRIRKLRLKNPQLDVLFEAIAKGFPIETACDRARMSRRQVLGWQTKGESLLTENNLDQESCPLPLGWDLEDLPGSSTVALEAALTLSDRDSVYVSFALALREARAIGADFHVDVVNRSASEGNEKASMWALEHLFGMGVRGALALKAADGTETGFAVLAMPNNGRDRDD